MINENQKPGFDIFKLIKTIIIILGVGFFLILIVVGYIFYKLPSSEDLSGFFKNKNLLENKKTQKNEQANIHSIQSMDATKSNDLIQANTVSENKQTTESEAKDPIQKIDEFLDDKTPVVVFCEKLNKSRSGPVKVPESIQQDNVNELTEDPRFEAIMPFVKVILKKPEMRKLISMTMQDQAYKDANQTKNSLYDKAQLYAQAYSVYNEMKNNVNEYESVMDETYLLYKMNDLVAFKPELFNDQRVLKFCEDTEFLFNSHANMNIENQKQIFERLIQEVGVDQKQIKYDPNYKTKLNFDFSPHSLQLSGGWLNDIMQSENSKENVKK